MYTASKRVVRSAQSRSSSVGYAQRSTRIVPPEARVPVITATGQQTLLLGPDCTEDRPPSTRRKALDERSALNVPDTNLAVLAATNHK